MAFSCLVTLSISSLRNLDIEANKFNDRAHRLCVMMQHFLPVLHSTYALGPYIDTKINQIRHFIKI